LRRIGTYPVDVLENAIKAFGSAERWKSQSRMEVIESELPLVSERYKFGGTLDAAMVHDRLSLGDWKTGKLYDSHLIQVCGGYALLWEENFPDRPITGGFNLLSFTKEGDFGHKWWQDVPEAKRAFLLMRELYDLVDKIKKRI